MRYRECNICKLNMRAAIPWGCGELQQENVMEDDVKVDESWSRTMTGKCIHWHSCKIAKDNLTSARCIITDAE